MNAFEVIKSKAVVNYGRDPHSVEVREVETPSLKYDEVLVEVKSVGVCGSDVHQWESTHSWGVNYPVVLGHEFAGIIHSLGEGVEDWKVGDSIVSETAAIIDKNSPMTKIGLYNLDPSRKGFGYGVNGAMTKYVAVPARCLHRIPETLSFDIACMTEPCCVAYNAVVINADINPGDRVIVIGPGTIGILCAIMAKLRGAEVAVVGLESDRKRLTIAETYGCTAIIEDALEWALKVDGMGADCIVDAAGASITLKKALDWVRPNGQIVKVGWGPQPLNFSLDPLVQKNVRLQGSFSHNWLVWEKVIKLLSSGQLDVERLIGGVWAIQNWEEAFIKMKDGEVVKSIIKP